MGNRSPSTSVKAPLPFTTKRMAAMLWRCGRAISPGFTTEKVNSSVREVARVGFWGFTSRMALRSASSSPTDSLASMRHG